MDHLQSKSLAPFCTYGVQHALSRWIHHALIPRPIYPPITWLQLVSSTSCYLKRLIVLDYKDNYDHSLSWQLIAQFSNMFLVHDCIYLTEFPLGFSWLPEIIWDHYILTSKHFGTTVLTSLDWNWYSSQFHKVLGSYLIYSMISLGVLMAGITVTYVGAALEH